MDDFLSEDTKATLLLCGSFGNGSTTKPLSLGEYTCLVHWLKAVHYRPRDLLQMGSHTAEACRATGLEVQRMDALLSRGLQLGFAIEEWQRYGIWIMGRSDADYPARYKIALKDKAPPILFGVGDRSLLQGGGLAIVGSRDVDHDSTVFTKDVAKLCAQNRMTVVSGCAKGVDQIAMQTAMHYGGYSIGIVADSLLKRSVEPMFRKAIAHGSLVLLSPNNPAMPFAAWAAMDRNKLIYAMADYGLVVRADFETGGTWGGASEELKREHGCPLFVRQHDGAPIGNAKLMQLGAMPWPHDIENHALSAQLQQCVTQRQSITKQSEPSLFDFLAPQDVEPVVQASSPQNSHEHVCTSTTIQDEDTIAHADIHKNSPSHEVVACFDATKTIYDTALPYIIHALQTSQDGLSLDELSVSLDIHKTQLSIWLKRALDGNKIHKLMKPTRYTVVIKS